MGLGIEKPNSFEQRTFFLCSQTQDVTAGDGTSQQGGTGENKE